MSIPKPPQPTVVRSFMLWLFDVPHGEPYVMTTVDFRWERALSWIEEQNAREGARITTQHVFTAAVGRGSVAATCSFLVRSLDKRQMKADT